MLDAEIRAGRGVGGGHRVPGGAAAADVVERGERARQMERLAVGGRGGGGKADPAGRGGERRRAPSAARTARSATDGRPRCWSGRRPGTPCRTWRVRRSPPAAPDAAGSRCRNPRRDSASRPGDALRPAGTCRDASAGVARAWTCFLRERNDSRPVTACRQRSCRCMLPPKQGGDCHATVRRHPGHRRHPRSGGAVRGLSTGRAGRRRDQGRASRRSRPEPLRRAPTRRSTASRWARSS